MEITKRGKQIFQILKYYYRVKSIKVIIVSTLAEKGIKNIISTHTPVKGVTQNIERSSR